MRRLSIRLALLGAVTAMTVAIVGSGASATHVDPVFVAGNPDCQDLGYQIGFKPQPEPPPTGTYNFGDPSTVPVHALTGDSVTITSDGTFFDWVSTLGIDAVIVKGGPNANVYVYDPPAEEFADTGLHSPLNPNNNDQPFAISHIEFCYDFEVTVEKTANTTFTRTWTWTIDKTADQTELELAEGQSFPVTYWVDVDASATDSAWAVSGEIWVTNDTPFDATIVEVDDVVSPAIGVALVCPELPAILTPGDSLHCTYSTPLADGSSRTNTATVSTSGLVGGNSADADVIFGDPTTEIDEQITVSDSNVGELGTVTASQAPASFHYMKDVRGDCGVTNVFNTASFETNDTMTTGESVWQIVVTVDCDGGCTLTLGYWKTHSARGPAPFDDAWDWIGGADSPFLGSGQTYYEVLWTAPKGGNAWYLLAHQYIAATLNHDHNHASAPQEVVDALSEAEALLTQYEGATSIPKRNGSDRDTAIDLASLLDDYNNGVTGPGHCDE